jgi:creatinine amidohydrolase
MEIVCRDLRINLGMFAVSSKWSSFADLSDLFTAEERKHGIHAGEVETSVMRYLHPELVDMSLAEDFPALSQVLEKEYELLMTEGGAVGFGWQMQDINPKGACGNALAADVERGSISVERAADKLITLIGEVMSYPLSRLKSGPDYSPNVKVD